MNYSYINNDGLESLTVIQDGEIYSANSTSHANFASIRDEVFAAHKEGRGVSPGLFDLETAVRENFNKVSDRVSVRGGQVYLDGDPVNSVLTKHIVRALENGDDFAPLVKFYENIEANPNEHSREQLYPWLDAHDFTINEDGFILGYKGVQGAKDDDLWYSISSGNATVNGVEHLGHIPQTTGDIVEMPRGDVQHDPSRGCHTGLHVGTWAYASDFSRGTVLEVIVNPRDVVSVPTDCGYAKMRTCRYVVGKALDGPYASAIQRDYADEVDVPDDEPEDNVGEREISGGRKDFTPYVGGGIYTGSPSVTYNVPATANTVVYQNIGQGRKTDDNYKQLKRGPGGRFLPKGS